MTTLTTSLDLQEKIAEELAFDPSVDATQIGVAAKDGVVTLSGTVPTFFEKFCAEKAAKRVKGVKGLASELKIELMTAHKRTDAEIVASAINILSWNVNVPSDAITVTVENGWMTLEGNVPWQYQREAVSACLRHLTGIRGMTNLITIKPHVKAANIREKLCSALERQSDDEVNRLIIDANNQTITIRGVVRSWAEHEKITSAAYAVPGVAIVENLTVVE